jgi:hypothetical protein
MNCKEGEYSVRRNGGGVQICNSDGWNWGGWSY